MSAQRHINEVLLYISLCVRSHKERDVRSDHDLLQHSATVRGPIVGYGA